MTTPNTDPNASPETTPTTPPAQPSGSAPTPAASTSEHMIPKSRLDEVLAKQHAAETELQKLRDDLTKKEREALEKQGEWKQVAEDRAKELEVIKVKADQVESLQATLKETLDATLKELSDDARKLVPTELSVEQQLRWVSSNKALLVKAPAPDLRGGKRTGSGNGASQLDLELTTEQKDIAKRFGMPLEEYAKYNTEGNFQEAVPPPPLSQNPNKE